MMRCPSCDGKGKGFALVNYGGKVGCKPMEMNCSTCSGTGEVSDEHYAWLAAGKALRADRIARDRSLGEEARERGMKVTDLSAMEHGRVKSVPREKG